MFSFSVSCHESLSSDDFSESSDELMDVSVKENGGAERERERKQVEYEFKELDEATGQEQHLGAEGELCLNMQQDDESLDLVEEPYEDMAQELQRLDLEQEQYVDSEQQLYEDMERDQHLDMGDEQYQQTPPGILNFRMCTALPKHNTKNITIVIVILRFFLSSFPCRVN